MKISIQFRTVGAHSWLWMPHCHRVHTLRWEISHLWRCGIRKMRRYSSQKTYSFTNSIIFALNYKQSKNKLYGITNYKHPCSDGKSSRTIHQTVRV